MIITHIAMFTASTQDISIGLVNVCVDNLPVASTAGGISGLKHIWVSQPAKPNPLRGEGDGKDCLYAVEQWKVCLCMEFDTQDNLHDFKKNGHCGKKKIADFLKQNKVKYESLNAANDPDKTWKPQH